MSLMNKRVDVLIIVEPKHNIDYSFRRKMREVPQVGDYFELDGLRNDPVYGAGFEVARNESIRNSDGSLRLGIIYVTPMALKHAPLVAAPESPSV